MTAAVLKRRVFVVEDDADLREIIVSFLETSGWTARGLAPRPFTERVLDEVDVLVLDVRSFASACFKTFERVRAQRPALPVVVIASFGDTYLSRRAEGMGAARVLEKPFNLEDLERVLVTVTDRP